jgi:head-tail adaptor
MIGHLLNRELTVYRAAYVADGAGGRTRTLSEHGTVRGMVTQPSDEERQVAAQEGARLDSVVYTTNGADVERGDELDDGGARRLRVVSVIENSRETYARLHCEVVQGE